MHKKGRNMKVWYVVVCFILVASNELLAYRKFQYMAYDYKIPGKQNVTNAQCLAPYELPSFSLIKADYCIKGPKGATAWVKLSLADKRHMKRLFSLFPPSAVVTDEMIASFLHSKERMKWKVVGLILRDFKMSYGRPVRIQDIRYALQL